jgi:hypothetical protein
MVTKVSYEYSYIDDSRDMKNSILRIPPRKKCWATTLFDEYRG